jgi:hypothetical protein
VLGFGGSGFQEVFVVVDGRHGQGLVDGTATEGAFSCDLGIRAALELEFHAGALSEIGDGIHE